MRQGETERSCGAVSLGVATPSAPRGGLPMSMLLKRSLPALALLVAGATVATAQPLPTSQPKILTIYREQVKVGHVGAHVKTESG